jgi:uncharacterized protein
MQNYHKKFAAALSTEGLADKRQVLVNCSSESVDRQGDIVVQSGINTAPFMKTGGTVLWNHDPNFPIAKAVSIGVEGGQLRSLAQFPPAGVSPKADEIYGLVKAGFISSVSIGFRGTDFVPIETGLKFNQSELLEFSFVSVPAQIDANVIARAMGKSANSPQVAEVMRLLDKSADCHQSGLSFMAKSDAHRAEAIKCMKQIAEQAPDGELSAEAARRKALAALDAVDMGTTKPQFIAHDGGAHYAADRAAAERARIRQYW